MISPSKKNQVVHGLPEGFDYINNGLFLKSGEVEKGIIILLNIHV